MQDQRNTLMHGNVKISLLVLRQQTNRQGIVDPGIKRSSRLAWKSTQLLVEVRGNHDAQTTCWPVR
jgi:hypothetical protein